MRNRRHFDAHTKRLVAAHAKWICATCNELLDETYEIDHVIPLHKGGEDNVSNMVPRHSKCHKEKTIREEIERLKKLKAPRRTLTCNDCGHILSPFFFHKCNVGYSAVNTESSEN